MILIYLLKHPYKSLKYFYFRFIFYFRFVFLDSSDQIFSSVIFSILFLIVDFDFSNKKNSQNSIGFFYYM